MSAFDQLYWDTYYSPIPPWGPYENYTAHQAVYFWDRLAVGPFPSPDTPPPLTETGHGPWAFWWVYTAPKRRVVPDPSSPGYATYQAWLELKTWTIPAPRKQGLEVYNAAGLLAYTSSDVTWNQVDFFQVNAGSSTTRTFPVLAGRETLLIQVFIDPPPLNRRAIAHLTSVVGTSVTVGGGSENVFVLVLMR